MIHHSIIFPQISKYHKNTPSFFIYKISYQTQYVPKKHDDLQLLIDCLEHRSKRLIKERYSRASLESAMIKNKQTIYRFVESTYTESLERSEKRMGSHVCPGQRVYTQWRYTARNVGVGSVPDVLIVWLTVLVSGPCTHVRDGRNAWTIMPLAPD